jgi:ADP-ribose pyrophosphatase
MMGTLTEYQRHALEAYAVLMARRPSLFEGRHARPLVRNAEALAAYASAHGAVLGVVAQTPAVYLIVDLVESRVAGSGTRRHPYLRVVSRNRLEGRANVVVLGTIDEPSLGSTGDIVLVHQERHALGSVEIELPRGFAERTMSGEANALRELREETGYVGERARFLGSTCPDSGLTDEIVSFYHVPVVQRIRERPEVEEAIDRVRLATRQEVWDGIRSGAIRDGFTLQALALYENE